MIRLLILKKDRISSEYNAYADHVIVSVLDHDVYRIELYSYPLGVPRPVMCASARFSEYVTNYCTYNFQTQDSRVFSVRICKGTT